MVLIRESKATAHEKPQCIMHTLGFEYNAYAAIAEIAFLEMPFKRFVFQSTLSFMTCKTRSGFHAFFITSLLLLSFPGQSADKPSIRLGALAFGTVNWELAALKNEGLLNTAEFTLHIVPMATPQAGKIALQSNAVDVIVSDWIWTSRMRGTGTGFTFYPYSATSGAIVVAADSPVNTLQDLADKRIGIAGGELDKNWLLLQALARDKNIDLSGVNKIYGAPPLLNQQLKQQRIDAVINYWHFAARLEGEGYRTIMKGTDIIRSLGIPQTVPTLGYVFRQSWGESQSEAINAFLQLTRNAKDLLCTNDAAWQKVVPLSQANTPEVQQKLRERYCQGRVQQWGIAQQQAAQTIYHHLHALSAGKLTGTSDTITPGTFWQLH